MLKSRGLILIAVIFTVSMSLFAQQYNAESDFEFRIIDNGRAVEITKYIGNSLTVGIPPTIQSLPVTRIGEEAFIGGEYVLYEWVFYENHLTSVTIPNSVTHIGDKAFSENQLSNITIPNSVIHIGERAFQDNQLTSITIPNNVNHIGEWAFSKNRLTNVIIPDNVSYIGGASFRDNRITNIRIGNNVGFDERYKIFDDALNNFVRNRQSTNRGGNFELRNNRWMVIFPETNLPATPERLANTIWEIVDGRGGRIEFGQTTVRFIVPGGDTYSFMYRVEGDAIIFIERRPNGRDLQYVGSLIRGVLSITITDILGTVSFQAVRVE